METLSATQLFVQGDVLMLVREFSLDTGPLTVTAEAVKVFFALSEDGQLRSGGEKADLVQGQCSQLPLGRNAKPSQSPSHAP